MSQEGGKLEKEPGGRRLGSLAVRFPRSGGEGLEWQHVTGKENRIKRSH